MTTSARVRIDPSVQTHRISPYVYGHFIEHLGGCVDGGIWVGPESDVPNDDGLRLDTIAALKAIRPPVVRWPGGLWADNYHWQDGIGPRSERPIRQNLGWNRLEDSQFGTHEFMRFCEAIGTEAYLCCNLGTGTVEEARSWAEYCNCAQDTTLTRQRAKNGHPEPFGVKFWGLGNEAGYALDGLMSASGYAERARGFAGYVKMFAAQANVPWDTRMHDAKTVLALMPSWLEAFFAAIPDAERPSVMCFMDLLAHHFYTGGALPPEAAERDKYVGFLDSLGALERDLKLYCDWARKLSTDYHSVDVAVDEWGLWRKEADHREHLVQKAAHSDAVFAAAVLHVFHSDEKIYMANLAQTANVLHALILTEGKNFCLTPTYHVFEMMQGHQGAVGLEVTVDCDASVALPEGEHRAALSVAATQADGGSVLVSLVNVDPESALTVTLDLPQGARRVRQLAAPLDACNSFEAPRNVQPKNLPTDATLALPPASVTTVCTHPPEDA